MQSGVLGGATNRQEQLLDHLYQNFVGIPLSELGRGSFHPLPTDLLTRWTGVSVERHWPAGGVERPQGIFQTIDRNEPREAAIEGSHRDAPHQWLTL